MEWNKLFYASLLLLIPILFFGVSHLKSWSEERKKFFSDSEAKRNAIFYKTKSWQYWLIYSSYLLTILFLILALMDPVDGFVEKEVKTKGADVVFTLDLSNSMNTEDVSPNRLEKAKKIIESYLDFANGNRVGLVYFAGNAHVASPLTSDYSSLKRTLDVLETDLVFNQGTNLSNAIMQSLILLEETPPESKAIVLLSDGEDHEEDLKDALDKANKEKSRIHAIGIGTEKGGIVPVVLDGNIVGFKQEDGATAKSALKPAILKEIANKTNGIYLEGGPVNGFVEKLNTELNTLTKQNQKTNTMSAKEHKFQWFLIPAVVLFFVFLIFDRKYILNKNEKVT